MQAERKRPWPPSHVDFLGRGWLNTKLDRLLADPEVTAAVRAMDKAARGSNRMFRVEHARAWAQAAGRSEPAFALLLVLRRRWLDRLNGRAA